MSNFLDDYVDVAQRLDEFKHLDPEKLGRIITELLPLPDAFAAKFIAVKATVYRPGETEIAGTGIAWEPVPGQTSFTKNSEAMVCETSAVGRALVNALVASTKRGIASKEEVSNRAAGKSGAEIVGRASPTRREPAAPSGSSGVSATKEGPPRNATTDAKSPSSAAPETSVAGVEETPPRGRGGVSTPSASDHQHDWQPAPNPDAAKRGFHVCKECGIPQKDPK